MHCVRVMLLIGLLVSPFGVTWGQQVSLSGQIRPRIEFRDPVGATRDAFTSMRVRLGARVTIDEHVSAFVQMQDVRIFGEETNTLTDFRADNFDVHQAYIDVHTPGGSPRLAARVGRQELLFGGQRLVGPVGWTQQGRSFDGVKLTADAEAVRVDVIGAQLTDATAVTATDNSYFVGSYATVRNAGPGALDLYVLFNAMDGAVKTNQATLGARWAGDVDAYQFRGELSYQGGDRSGIDVSAFMFGARVGRAFADGKGRVTLWYDYLSGDDDPTDGTVKVFDTLFATNHKFYGFADYFLNIPVNTGGRGLQDIAVKGSVNPHERVTLALDVHSFHAAKSAGLSTGHFGEELDFTAGYRHNRNFGVSAGLSYFIQADGFAEIGQLAENALWTYLMLDVTF